MSAHVSAIPAADPEAVRKRADQSLYTGNQRIVRRYADVQLSGHEVAARRIYVELKDVLPDFSLRDTLFAHQPLIPDEWECGVTVFFEENDEEIRVSGLYKENGTWYILNLFPDDRLDLEYFVAVYDRKPR